MIDLKSRNVDLESVRDGLGRTAHVDRVGHDVNRAAALDAGGLVSINDANRNAHPEGGPFAQPHEIHMNRRVAHRIDLEIARDHPVLGAVYFDVVKTGQELAGVDPLAQLRMVERDVERGLIVPIDYAGHAARTANGPGGPLTGLRARHCLDFLDGRHFSCSLLCVKATRRADRVGRKGSPRPFALLSPHLPWQAKEGSEGKTPAPCCQYRPEQGLVPRPTSRGVLEPRLRGL